MYWHSCDLQLFLFINLVALLENYGISIILPLLLLLLSVCTHKVPSLHVERFQKFPANGPSTQVWALKWRSGTINQSEFFLRISLVYEDSPNSASRLIRLSSDAVKYCRLTLPFFSSFHKVVTDSVFQVVGVLLSSLTLVASQESPQLQRLRKNAAFDHFRCWVDGKFVWVYS